MLLVGLYRLHRPNCQSDSFFRDQMGLKQEYTSMAASLFLSHLLSKWSYLLTNHLDFWQPRFAALAEAGRQKFIALSGRDIAPATDDDGFRFVGFIDCSIFATCRPGGGPTRPGANAPRHNNNIQRAMYTGWKSVHGLKIQTFNLMNGMTAHCSDVYSCREPDSIVLQESGLENLFSRVQLRSPIQYLIWGDSAYQDTLLQHIFSFKSLPMASMRESIEQDYRELKTNWSFLDHKKGLKVLLNRVGHEILCALIMHNAFLTLNNGKTAATYGIATPTLEEWLSKGPRRG